jgi:ABC-type Zn2+ transport system substrate-binding protein/surface adhesin
VTPLAWEKRNTDAMSSITIDPELKPGEFVIKSLFAEFAVLAEKKIEVVMAEPLVSPDQSIVQQYTSSWFMGNIGS